MKPVIFITGAPGSGKSSVARRLAEQYPRSLHLQVDQLREMMVSGLALPGGERTEEKTLQFQWARRTASFMAELYAAQDVTVIIDDVSIPEFFPEQYAELFQKPDMKRVLLLPELTALVERIQQRGGPHDSILATLVPRHYQFLETMNKDGWIVLNTANWSVEDTVNVIRSKIL